jgi:hypothetical protein
VEPSILVRSDSVFSVANEPHHWCQAHSSADHNHWNVDDVRRGPETACLNRYFGRIFIWFETSKAVQSNTSNVDTIIGGDVNDANRDLTMSGETTDDQEMLYILGWSLGRIDSKCAKWIAISGFQLGVSVLFLKMFQEKSEA